MSLDYDLYLNEHKMNVMRAFDWLAKNVLIDGEVYYTEDCLRKTAAHIVEHDASKFFTEEYIPYDNHFYLYPNDKLFEDEFNQAWLYHIHENPHHWQHWVLVNDDPELGTIALEMPIDYIIEMICDWWSFSWKTGNLYEIFNWYEKNKDHMVLHVDTRESVECILKQMRNKLNKEKK